MSSDHLLDLSKLTEEQDKKISELSSLKDKWEMTERTRAWCTKETLYRYLSGLQWDMKVASEHLKETTEWRDSFKPEDITLDDIESIFKQGYIFQVGEDKLGRPIVYLKLGLDKAENKEESVLLKFKCVVWIMENTKMKAGVTKYKLFFLFKF
jgi:hypothetical protein